MFEHASISDDHLFYKIFVDFQICLYAPDSKLAIFLSFHLDRYKRLLIHFILCNINPYWQILGNPSKNFSEISISASLDWFLENSSRQLSWVPLQFWNNTVLCNRFSQFLFVGLSHDSNLVTYFNLLNSLFWMSFPKIGPAHWYSKIIMIQHKS